jgi:drug/metabolite transporter (DMT)-like permease
MLNVVNRILFQNYKFLFNFTLIFLQQLTSLILFTCGTNNKNFKSKVGELSFQDFKKNKWYYIIFTIVFIANTFFNFYGNQLVKNISMFLSLKKLTLVMLFFIDFFYGKKKLSCITITCIFLVAGGSILVGMDSFSNDYFGYVVVFFNNVTAISYSKFTEVFRKSTGVSNLKLLVYNNYLAVPILIVVIFCTGESQRLYVYFTSDNGSEGTLIGLAVFLFISCLFCAILTSSFFISNEKNSSLLTNLLTNTKTIFTSVTLYLFDKAKNKLSIPIFIGLVMSTLGAIFINAESLFYNLSFKKGKDKKKDKEDKKPEETELIEVKEDEKNENEEKNKNDEKR